MKMAKKTKVVPYTAKQMYALVADVNSYPQFIPWCPKTKVLPESENTVVASLFLNAYGFEQELTTRNIHNPLQSINMQLVKGPFKQFHGEWRFISINHTHCEVSCELYYELSQGGAFLGMIAPLLNDISDHFVHVFVKRAEVLYGSN